MKEFTSLIKVASVTDAKSFEFFADYFEFTPTSSEDDGGVYWTCDKTFVIDMPDEEALLYFGIDRNAIVTLTSSDRTTHEIGTDEIPARVRISVHLNKAQLVMTCKMLKNPLV